MHCPDRSPTISLADHLAAARPSSLLYAGSASVALPLLATTLAGPAIDPLLLGGAGLSAVGWCGAWLWRRTIRSLPLELAPHACRGQLGGHPLFRFRARLGRNRILTQAEATVRFVGSGEPVLLTPEPARLPVAVGPWTIAVVDRERQCEGDGRFEVTVRVREGQRQWSATHSYDTASLLSGRFGADLRVEGERLVVDIDRWDEVVDEAA